MNFSLNALPSTNLSHWITESHAFSKTAHETNWEKAPRGRNIFFQLSAIPRRESMFVIAFTSRDYNTRTDDVIIHRSILATIKRWNRATYDETRCRLREVKEVEIYLVSIWMAMVVYRTRSFLAQNTSAELTPPVEGWTTPRKLLLRSYHTVLTLRSRINSCFATVSHREPRTREIFDRHQ